LFKRLDRMNASHLIAVTVIPDLRENSLVLCTNGLPEPRALSPQKTDAFSSTKPSAHCLRLHAMPVSCGNEIGAGFDHVDNGELYAFGEPDRTHRLTARSGDWHTNPRRPLSGNRGVVRSKRNHDGRGGRDRASNDRGSLPECPGIALARPLVRV
jgi:hypothetical protein